MTSTNDGRDVKIIESSGAKGKIYYIELYKSLESRLSEDQELPARTGCLKAAWQQIHTLCLHSAPNTHPHLLSWLQRHTAKTVLQTEWQSPNSKPIHAILEDGITAFTRECETAVATRNGRCLAWEAQLLQRAEWFKTMLGNPWGHPVLRMLLDPRGTKPSNDEVLEWLKEERGVLFVTRLRQLSASKCDDLALTLAGDVMTRVRDCTELVPDNEQTTAQEEPNSGEPTFKDILSKEAGFTVDVWEVLTDMEFVLLHKSDKRSQCIDLAKQTPLRDGYQLVERLQSRIEASPKEKKLWKNAKEVATLIAQVIIARCMVISQCIGVARTALYCCARSLARLLPASRLPAAAAALAAPAHTARHVHTFASAARAQLNTDSSRSAFVCELYVRAITAGMNELERLKLKTEKEAEARSQEQTLAAWFCQLGNLLCASDRIKCECLLTAFSIYPAPDMYERIRALPTVQKYKEQAQDQLETTSEFGSWASDSRSQTNLVKTSETLNMKQTQSRNNVLSVAMLNEGETVGLGPELCQDLAVLLSGPRLKTLSWDMDREELLKNCQAYMERTGGGTRALTTELKFLNLDPNKYQHLPEEDENVDDVYYGIEKGYEHLVEFQDPEPEEIWQDAIFSETQSSQESDSSHNTVASKSKRKAKKKTKRIIPASSESETDPLSLADLKEAKKTETQKEKKKDRPHSKERKSEKKKPQPKVKNQFDKTKVRAQSKEKKEPKQRKGTAERSQSKEKRKDSSQSKERKKEKRKEGGKIRKKQTSNSNNMELSKLIAATVSSEQKDKSTSITDPLQSRQPSNLQPESYINKDVKRPMSQFSNLSGFNPSGFNQAFLTHLQKTVAPGILGKSLQATPSTSKSPVSQRKVKTMQTKVRNIVGQLQQNTGPISPLIKSQSTTYVAPSLHSPKTELKVPTRTSQAQHDTISDEVKKSITRLIKFRKPKIDKVMPSNISASTSDGPLPLNSPNKLSDRATKEERMQSLREQMNFLLNFNPTNHSHVSVKDTDTQHSKSVLTNTPPEGTIQSTAKMSPLLTAQLAKLDHRDKARPHQPKKLSSPIQALIKNVQKKIDNSKVTDPIRNIAPGTNSISPASQLPKQASQIKKVDNAPNTFSRLSYLHKNKQEQSKSNLLEAVASTFSTRTDQTTAELDKLIAEQHTLKAYHNSRAANLGHADNPGKIKKSISKIRTYRKSNEKTNKHGSANTTHDNQTCSSNTERVSQTVKPADEQQNKRTKASSSSNNLTMQDQAELLLLLHQQSILNTGTNSSPETRQSNTRLHSNTTAVQPNAQSTLPKTPTYCTDSIHLQEQQKIHVTSNLSSIQRFPNKNEQHPNIPKINKSKKSAVELPEPKPTECFTKSANLIIKSMLNSPSVLERKASVEPIKINKLITQSKENPEVKPNNSSKQNEKQDWESVMNLLLAQKTPCRGPNALDMTLKKSVYKPNAELKPENTETTAKVPAITASAQRQVLKSTSATSLSKHKGVLANTQSNIQKIDTNTMLQPQVTVEPKVVINKVVPCLPTQLSKDDDPFMSGIPNSDYDLLEELMDDELRQEIGELSSDDDTFNSRTGLNKSFTKSKEQKFVSKQFKTPSVERKSTTAPVVSCNKQTDDEQSIVDRTVHYQTPNTSTTFTKTKESTHSSPNNFAYVRPETTQNVSIISPVIANIPGPVNAANYIMTQQQPQVQNMFLIGTDMVYDPFTSVQIQNTTLAPNTILAVNSTPIGLYRATQVVAPIVNPILVQHHMTLQQENLSVQTSLKTIENIQSQSTTSTDSATTQGQVGHTENKIGMIQITNNAESKLINSPHNVPVHHFQGQGVGSKQKDIQSKLLLKRIQKEALEDLHERSNMLDSQIQPVQLTKPTNQSQEKHESKQTTPRRYSKSKNTEKYQKRRNMQQFVPNFDSQRNHGPDVSTSQIQADLYIQNENKQRKSDSETLTQVSNPCKIQNIKEQQISLSHTVQQAVENSTVPHPKTQNLEKQNKTKDFGIQGVKVTKKKLTNKNKRLKSPQDEMVQLPTPDKNIGTEFQRRTRSYSVTSKDEQSQSVNLTQTQSTPAGIRQDEYFITPIPKDTKKVDEKDSKFTHNIFNKDQNKFQQNNIKNELGNTAVNSKILISDDTRLKKKLNLDNILQKQLERKVLSEVQEKFAGTVEKLETKCDNKNEERIKEKRYAIINRQISHHSYYPSIPLRYSPLTVINSTLEDPSTHEIIATLDKCLKQGISIERKGETCIENSESIEYALTPDSQDDVENKSMEISVNDHNDDKPQCRRILLRSSNKHIDLETSTSQLKPKKYKKVRSAIKIDSKNLDASIVTNRRSNPSKRASTRIQAKVAAVQEKTDVDSVAPKRINSALQDSHTVLASLLNKPVSTTSNCTTDQRQNAPTNIKKCSNNISQDVSAKSKPSIILTDEPSRNLENIKNISPAQAPVLVQAGGKQCLISELKEKLLGNVENPDLSINHAQKSSIKKIELSSESLNTKIISTEKCDDKINLPLKNIPKENADDTPCEDQSAKHNDSNFVVAAKEIMSTDVVEKYTKDTPSKDIRAKHKDGNYVVSGKARMSTDIIEKYTKCTPDKEISAKHKDSNLFVAAKERTSTDVAQKYTKDTPGKEIGVKHKDSNCVVSAKAKMTTYIIEKNKEETLGKVKHANHEDSSFTKEKNCSEIAKNCTKDIPTIDVGAKNKDSNSFIPVNKESMDKDIVEKFKKCITINETRSEDPNVRCARIQLPNKKAFKVTITGGKSISYDSILENPDIRRYLLSSVDEDIKQYTINVQKPILSTKPSPTLGSCEQNMETIDLLSDDEDINSINMRTFKTEFGSYSVRNVDNETYNKHQFKFLQKSFITLHNCHAKERILAAPIINFPPVEEIFDADDIILISDINTAMDLPSTQKNPVSLMNKDVIEIDDSSNDDDDLRQYILPIETNSSVSCLKTLDIQLPQVLKARDNTRENKVTKTEEVAVIDLKNKLLQELDLVETTSGPNISNNDVTTLDLKNKLLQELDLVETASGPNISNNDLTTVDLKNKLLQDLDPNLNPLDTVMKNPSVFNIPTDIEVTSEPNILNKELTTFKIKQSAEVLHICPEIIMRQCFVKLVRCDQKTQIIQNPTIIELTDTDPEEPSSAVSSRRGSFSILNELPISLTESVTDELNQCLPQNITNLIDPGRSSPVMEIYELLTNFGCYKQALRQTLVPLMCESDYLATKTHYHLFNKKQLNNLCILRYAKVPSLISLVTLLINNAESINYPFYRSSNLKRKLIAQPGYVFTMKRSRKSLVSKQLDQIDGGQFNITKHLNDPANNVDTTRTENALHNEKHISPTDESRLKNPVESNCHQLFNNCKQENKHLDKMCSGITKNNAAGTENVLSLEYCNVEYCEEDKNTSQMCATNFHGENILITQQDNKVTSKSFDTRNFSKKSNTSIMKDTDVCEASLLTTQLNSSILTEIYNHEIEKEKNTEQNSMSHDFEVTFVDENSDTENSELPAPILKTVVEDNKFQAVKTLKELAQDELNHNRNTIELEVTIEDINSDTENSEFLGNVSKNVDNNVVLHESETNEDLNLNSNKFEIEISFEDDNSIEGYSEVSNLVEPRNAETNCENPCNEATVSKTLEEDIFHQNKNTNELKVILNEDYTNADSYNESDKKFKDLAQRINHNRNNVELESVEDVNSHADNCATLELDREKAENIKANDTEQVKSSKIFEQDVLNHNIDFEVTFDDESSDSDGQILYTEPENVEIMNEINFNKPKSLKELAQMVLDPKVNQSSTSSKKSYDKYVEDKCAEDFEDSNYTQIIKCLNSITSSQLATSSNEKPQQKMAVIYKNSDVILNGVLHEDPEIGTCYLFPYIENESNTINAEVLKATRDGLFEVVQEIDMDDHNIENEYSPEEISDTDLCVLIPKITYLNRSLCDSISKCEQKGRRGKKRKLEISGTKTSKTKYRKGKNIDYPKLTALAIKESAYEKEFKLLLDYISSVEFSYDFAFHKDYVDDNLHFNWPIKGVCEAQNNTQLETNNCIFDDYNLNKVVDPLQNSLANEINFEYDQEQFHSCKESEIFLNMGFGERSGRVLYNSGNGGSLQKFSAATLSDVKHSQPFLQFEDDEDVDCLKITSSKEDQLEKIKQYMKYFQLREKVRKFFKNTSLELNKVQQDMMSKKSNLNKEHKNCNLISELCKPDFIKPLPMETLVNVVQVGQLPVSTAAQNPVTCDPRVTQVSDASPSQCSVENSPRDDSQSGIKTEYTELTTADLSMPLMQNYSQHSQESPLDDGSCLFPPENLAIKAEIKEETTETSPNSADTSETSELLDLSKTMKKDDMKILENDISRDLCANQINNIDYSFDDNNTLETDTDVQMLFKSAEKETAGALADNKNMNGASDKTDQLAYAMNAAGITTTPESMSNNRAHALANILTQKICQSSVTTGQTTTNNFTKTTSINATALQQALAQFLPPLNQVSENSQTNQNPSVGPQVLHIVQSKNGSGNQITLLDNSQQSVINNPNSTSVLHIVQNKTSSTGVSNSGGTNIQQTNSYSGLSLVESGLQQGGNQLLHIVNTGNQKNGNTGQLIKRVNLLTNLTNVQGSNEQKMVQFVCKSADGKSIQLNGPHQRSMVLRLQPIETPTAQNPPPKPVEAQDASPSVNASNCTPGKDSSTQQEIKSRSVYEENYAKFIQSSSSKPSAGSEKSTSLPKFNQAFGKPVFQDGNQKTNDVNTNSNSLPSLSNNNNETNDASTSDGSINMDQINQMNTPPSMIQQKPAVVPTSQSQQNLMQQIKQTLGPMNIQTMHGGVIYTRQIPVNIGGGQTINLITVPSTELTDDPNQKSQSDSVKFINHNDMEPSIIKIIPQTVSNAEGQSDDVNNQARSGEHQNMQHQPVLTQMRIKLPMLSKAPQMVSGARVVRPSFFQIQRNVIGGVNQAVYQQLVLTTAPPLGQQTIRLPTQTQTQTRPVKLPSESQSSSESQMSSSTLEQLREFDMVLEQVKERSTVQPNGNSNNSFSGKIHTSSTDTTDGTGTVSSNTTDSQSVLYSIGVNQTANVAYVTRKAPVSTPTTSTFVRSPDSSGIADSPTSSTLTQHHGSSGHNDASNEASHHKSSKSSSKSKSRPKTSSNPPTAMKINNIPPKPSAQKPLEDEQTTQRILYILAEYKEQVENSPDKDKPAPRRRSNPPVNPPGSSKRKKSSSGSRRPGGRDMSPVHGDETCRTMGSEDSSCGTSQGDCTENCLDSHSPQDSPRKVARRLTFEQDNATPAPPQPRPQPQQPPRNVIVADGQTITVARGTAGKPATAVLMPANYILPVSMVKGGQQIAIVTNRGPKLLTVGGGGEAGTTNALLLQRLIGPAGLKPMLTRPGVRHVRLPTAALQNLQTFNLAASATTVHPPDSTASSATASQDIIENRIPNAPWTETQDSKLERGSSPDGSEPWNLPSSADNNEYNYEDVRADHLDRTVLDAIPDRYSPDMEAQRIFDKMFDTDSKKSYIVDSHDDSPRCGYDIDASDDDKAYQVVHKKDGTQQHRRLTHVSAAALRHKYAILEHELRLQKSLSEECSDLGVDSPSASELFPEAELLFAASPAQDHAPRDHSPPPPPQMTTIPQPDIDDQIATDQLLQQDHLDDRTELDVNLGLDVDGEIQTPLDHEEFARSHPNTTFHSEPTDDAVVQPFTITELKARHITSAIFHSNRAPATVLMTAPQTTVISQATAEGVALQNTVKYADIDNMINSIPGPHTNTINLASVLVKDDGLTRFDSILTDSRELHLTNTASAIVHATGNATQVIRRVCYDEKREREHFLMDEPDALMGEDAKMVAEDSSRDATLESMADVDDDRSSPERHTELFWESNSASERSESRRPLDFSSDSDKCCKSPSLDETNSTDSSGVGTHMRLDSVIKEARGIERSCSAEGSSADDTHPPLRTYPAAKRMYHTESDVERSLSGKTREGERSPDSLEVRRRASGRGVVKRGCHCCNGSPTPSRPKKSRPRKPNMEFH